jgi:hypothetical protein
MRLFVLELKLFVLLFRTLALVFSFVIASESAVSCQQLEYRKGFSMKPDNNTEGLGRVEADSCRVEDFESSEERWHALYGSTPTFQRRKEVRASCRSHSTLNYKQTEARM